MVLFIKINCLIIKLFSEFVEQHKKTKYLVLESGARRTFRLSSRTPLGYFLTSCPGLVQGRRFKATLFNYQITYYILQL